MQLLDQPWVRFLYGGPKPEGDNPYSAARKARRDYKHKSTKTTGKLDFLPELDEWGKPRFPRTAQSLASIMKEVWDSQKLLNSFYGNVLEQKNRDPYAPGGYHWEEAVRWIAEKHQPPQPEKPLTLDFDWAWPEVSQSPKPLGVGDLEDDYEDEGWDD